MRLIVIGFLLLAHTQASAQQNYLVDWEKAGAESVGHLVELIQIDTTNPPAMKPVQLNTCKAFSNSKASTRKPTRWTRPAPTLSLVSKAMVLNGRF